MFALFTQAQTFNQNVTFNKTAHFRGPVRIDSTLQITKSPGAGKVLTSSANGTATWQNPDSLLPYYSYVALLTQTDTNAPVATVLYNTFYSLPQWVYSGDGVYYVTLNGAFPIDKTLIICSPFYNDNIGENVFPMYVKSSANEIYLQTYTAANISTGITSSNLLLNTSFEIRAYK